MGLRDQTQSLGQTLLLVWEAMLNSRPTGFCLGLVICAKMQIIDYWFLTFENLMKVLGSFLLKKKALAEAHWNLHAITQVPQVLKSHSQSQP